MEPLLSLKWSRAINRSPKLVLTYPDIIELAENYIGNSSAETLVAAATKNEAVKYINLCTISLSLFSHNWFKVGNVYITAATKAALLQKKRRDLEM